MKELIKIRPYALILTFLYAWSLLNFEIGTYVGVAGILIYMVGNYLLKNEKEKFYPIVTLLIVFLVQTYALYARLVLLRFSDEIKVTGMEGAIGAGLLLMTYIVIAPFLSIIPAIQLAKINKKYFFAILPSAALAAYWYFYLYSVTNYY